MHPAHDCELCPLAFSRRSVVWGRGAQSAPIMILGEAPGYSEDVSGQPFVGRAGKLLDALMSKANVPSDLFYITNTVKCRPTTELGDNRRPTPREVEACNDWLALELHTVQPRVVLMMGRVAARLAFPYEDRVPVGVARATTIRDHPCVALCTWHPAFALRKAQYIPAIVRDLKRAKRIADEFAIQARSLHSGAGPA